MELMLGQVPAPQAEARTKGAFLTSAIPAQPPAGVDWGKGVVTWPESAPAWRVVQDCTDDVMAYGDDAEFSPVAARPFVIQTVTHCPRTSVDDMSARARRHLAAITSTAIARELWTGDATQTDPWTIPTTSPFALGNPRPAASGTDTEGPYLNPHLEAAEMLDAAATVDEAIGRVEAEVGDRLGGGPIFIHVPGDFILGLGADLVPNGNQLLTPLGSVVIADAGYPGVGASGTDLVVYGTGPVTYYLGDITVYDRSSWVVDHEQNHVAVYAERPALVLFDPQTLVGCSVSA